MVTNDTSFSFRMYEKCESKSLLTTDGIQWSILTFCMKDMHSFHFVRKDEGKDKNSKATA